MPGVAETAGTTSGQLRPVSVVVPVGPGESAWRSLLPDLAALPDQGEVILSGCEPAPEDLDQAVDDAGIAAPVAWQVSPRSRPGQLNEGAQQARCKWLLFIHADSRLEKGWVGALARGLETPGRWIGYGQLAFLDDGPPLTRLNAWGANWRSALFGLPFGDQGFLIKLQDYRSLGGFNPQAVPGEDLDLVVRARASGLKLRPLGLRVHTSARRYREEGWLRTTVRNLVLTWRFFRRAHRNLPR